MPELWLPYGSVEVPIDLRDENLAEVFEPTARYLPDEVLSDRLKELAEMDNATILVSDGGKVLTKILGLYSRLLEEKNPPTPVKIYCSQASLPIVRRNCSQKTTRVSTIPEQDTAIEISGITVKVPKFLTEEGKIIHLCTTGFDPLFGFSGGAGSLMRLVAPKALMDATSIKEPMVPTPAVEAQSFTFASELAQKLKIERNVETVALSDGILETFSGDLRASHDEAKALLLNKCRKTLDSQANAILVSPGDDYQSSTLALSLKALWNVLPALSEKGQVVLMAECSQGLGSEALERYVSGRLDLNAIMRKREYVSGLEDILYLRDILSRNTIILVSSLPYYFAELKLGFRTANRSNDAISEVLKSLGSRTKFYVLPRGAESLLQLGA